MIVVLLFEPFPIWQARREQPAWLVRPLVTVAQGRVAALSREARRAGIGPGMPLVAARLLAPELTVVPAPGPALDAAWEALLEDLHGVTPWLEPLAPGRVALRLQPSEAGELAESYRARAGAAGDRETALLAALSAYGGQVRDCCGAETAFRGRLPLRFLRGVGVSPVLLERLAWLGVRRLGELERWTEAQLRAFCGAEAERLLPFVHGPRRTELARFAPPPVLAVGHAFDEPACEPWQIEPLLTRLAARLDERLAGRSAARLKLDALVGGVSFRAARLAKAPLRDAGAIVRLARLALADSGAAALGLDALELELAGLRRPAWQGALWPLRERRERAVRRVEQRFPGALLRIRELDPYALAGEHRLRFEPIAAPGEASGAASGEPTEAALPSSPAPRRMPAGA